MKSKKNLLLSLLVCFSAISAQELTLKLSQHPDKQAIITAVHGVRKDTLGIIQLDQKGHGSLAFKSKQPLACLVNLSIKDKAYLSYDFVLSPTESPTIICDMEYVYTQNTTMLHSPENDCLNRWFAVVAESKQKISTIQELSKLYKPEVLFAETLATEKQTVEKQLQKMRDTIYQSPLFAAKYMQFKLAQEELLAKVWESNEQRAIAKDYLTKMDFEALYGSSMWFAILNTCIEAYVKESPYYQTFGADVASSLKRIQNQQVYEDLIDASISITEKFGWNRDQEAIVDAIVKHKRIQNPQGKLLKIMQSYNLSSGKKAPDLEIITHVGPVADHNHRTQKMATNALKSKYSLLVFYQSGCGPCETTMQGLQGNYKALADKGIRIISLSADTDEQVFKNTSSAYPWKDKYCNFDGLSGSNFKNYAVIGTPTMFLLDSKGIILEKMASMEQVLNSLQ
jgi:thiol-disulfide isomerase/thioredoxin